MVARKAKKGKKPPYILKMKASDVEDPSSSRVGVGWRNRAGGITIKLNPGVVLNWRDCEDFMITLWPAEEEE